MRQIVAPDRNQFPIAVFKSILAGDIQADYQTENWSVGS